MKKTVSALIIAVFALSFAACGSTIAADKAFNTDPEQSAQSSTAIAEDTGGSAQNGITLPQDNRKIILNASIEMETQGFEDTCTALEKAVKEAGGYIASTTASQLGTQYDRDASYELRVPTKKYSDFLSSISGAGTVVRKSESTEDITSQYVDVEARLKSLKLQEERLYAMMEQAGELETLLAIQNQLTEVQYQIESYTSQQNTYNDLIEYATVNVYVAEVNRVTQQPKTFSERISAAFTSSWYNFWEGCKNFAVAAVGVLPFIILVAAAAVIGIAAALGVHNKNVTKRQKAASMGAYSAPGAAASYSSLYAQSKEEKPIQSNNAENKAEENK